MINDETKPLMTGHVLIRDAETKEVLRDVYNAINFENMSQALALALANRSNGSIFQMVFGNGGSVASAVGTLTYFAPNVTGVNAQLYNQTFSKIVDDNSAQNVSPASNFMTVIHTNGVPYTDIQITCTLDYSEPQFQPAFDNGILVNNTNPSGTGSPLGTYIFDELGLMTNPSTGSGLLLSHVIFSPISKTLNRSLEILYSVRIYLS